MLLATLHTLDRFFFLLAFEPLVDHEDGEKPTTKPGDEPDDERGDHPCEGTVNSESVRDPHGDNERDEGGGDADPTRSPSAYLRAKENTIGAKIACAAAKMTTAAMNPLTRNSTPGTSQAASSNATAAPNSEPATCAINFSMCPPACTRASARSSRFRIAGLHHFRGQQTAKRLRSTRQQ